MTPPRRRSAARGVAVGLVIAALVTALTACSSPPPPTRTTPNAVERAAVQEAVGYTGIGNPNADVHWVQLWTIRQYPTALKDCVAEASHGQLQLEVEPLPIGIVSYRNTGSNVHPTEVEAGQLIQTCIRATPIDRRTLSLATSKRAALYSYDLTVLRPCLLSHGFEVGKVPSLDRFENSIRSQLPWSPYDLVRVSSRAEWYEISDACPALPAELAGLAAG